MNHNMDQIIEEIGRIGIVPVVALDDAKDARPLAEALYRGGLPCAEVTFRTEAAEEAIRMITREFPDMLVGAGTVLSEEQVDRAQAAGARFIVSPGLNPRVVSYCQRKEIPMLPGTSNPSDVEAAIELGLEAVKFFPAEQAGGIAMIKAMSAPYTKMKFMPTGGINADNLRSYLDFEQILACGGSWMVKKDLVAAGRFDEIEELTKEAVSRMLGFELRHVGINGADEKEGEELAGFFGSMLGKSKTPHPGTRGHITIGVKDMDRARYHLNRRGISIEEATEERDANGKLKAVYLTGEMGGFAIHLVK